MGNTPAPGQGGILEGANPSIYDPKNPIVMFIIQASSTPLPAHSQTPGERELTWSLCSIGRYHHHLLSPPPLPPLQDSPAPCHRRSHRWHSPGPLGLRSHPRLHQCHLSRRLHAHPQLLRQRWLDSLSLPGGAGGRSQAAGQQLADCVECWGGGDGPTVWLGVGDCIWTVSSVQDRQWTGADQFRDVYAVCWGGYGHYGMDTLAQGT